MELAQLLSDQSSGRFLAEVNSEVVQQSVQLQSESKPEHLKMQAMHHQPTAVAVEGYSAYAENHAGNSVAHHQSPTSPVPKNVAFELLLDENSKVRARIPMRVQIFPHDTTDSIVTTVKNFYGIYEGAASGVSFEDEHGTTLIARYENLRNNMTVYVRVIPVHAYPEAYGEHYYGSAPFDAHKRPSLGEPFQGAPQPAHVLDYSQPPSRPVSRVARKRSVSPSGRSRRSGSQHKASTRLGNKSRGSSIHGSFHDDGMAAYSDSDGGHGSITGSKKARSEQFASSEISMDNILQDGRRKRPKFDSSELPLFVPPQVPLTTSTSSISPQRRSTGQEGAASPFARPAQRPYNFQQPLPSPQSYGYSEQAYGGNSARNSLYATPVVPEHGHRLRERTGAQSSGHFNYASRPSGPGILPTPDPTIASCISDEDVAMQLIRLGDASNFSHGRTSASTLDDAFSGAADASSSTGATSDGGDVSEDDDDDELPPRSRHKLESSPMLPPGAIKRTHKQLDEILPSFDSTDLSGDEVDEDYRQEELHEGLIKSELDDEALYTESALKAKKAKTKAASSISNKPRGTKVASVKLTKSNKNRPIITARKHKTLPAVGAQKTAPPQMVSPAPSQKASTSVVNFQPQLAADEEDLSTKPRCQRCRKSKKGCDRQRPCQRCKDAGIGAEGCISEDEGNGRKGRYGRHMGVPVKKAIEAATANDDMQPIGSAFETAPLPTAILEKNKKRKR